eukprot:scaffold328554_cov54-Tisochrysis_lutea.AAC.1
MGRGCRGSHPCPRAPRASSSCARQTPWGPRDGLPRAAKVGHVRVDRDAAAVLGRVLARGVGDARRANVLVLAGLTRREDLDKARDRRRRVELLAVVGQRTTLDEHAAVGERRVLNRQRVVADGLLLVR